ESVDVDELHASLPGRSSATRQLEQGGERTTRRGDVTLAEQFGQPFVELAAHASGVLDDPVAGHGQADATQPRVTGVGEALDPTWLREWRDLLGRALLRDRERLGQCPDRRLAHEQTLEDVAVGASHADVAVLAKPLEHGGGCRVARE